MDRDNDYEWAELLGLYFLDYQKDGQLIYSQLIDMIRNVHDAAFDITSGAIARTSNARIAIVTKKELPWEYLFECMRLSGKDFCLILPQHLKESFDEIIVEKSDYAIYGWYEESRDAIHVFAYTGHIEEEEQTYPAYDGWGRYDTFYEIVEGYINKDARWITQPQCRTIGLYGM